MRQETFSEELQLLEAFCAERGYTLEKRNPGPPQYQLAKITDGNFSVIAYPHKTSAGNKHIRLRPEGSKGQDKAYAVIAELDKLAGYNCTFQSKHATSHYNKWGK